MSHSTKTAIRKTSKPTMQWEIISISYNAQYINHFLPSGRRSRPLRTNFECIEVVEHTWKREDMKKWCKNQHLQSFKSSPCVILSWLVLESCLNIFYELTVWVFKQGQVLYRNRDFKEDFISFCILNVISWPTPFW